MRPSGSPDYSEAHLNAWGGLVGSRTSTWLSLISRPPPAIIFFIRRRSTRGMTSTGLNTIRV